MLNNKLKTNLDVVFSQLSTSEGLISLERYFPNSARVTELTKIPSGHQALEKQKLTSCLLI
jgi:hypothetical protein